MPRSRGRGRGKYRGHERERRERERLRVQEARANARNESEPAREVFMADAANRERVLLHMTSLSDDQQRELVSGNFEEFMSHRSEHMSVEQIAELDRVINRVRMSQWAHHVIGGNYNGPFGMFIG